MEKAAKLFLKLLKHTGLDSQSGSHEFLEGVMDVDAAKHRARFTGNMTELYGRTDAEAFRMPPNWESNFVTLSAKP